MSNLAKLEFVALDIWRKNFLSWILDVEVHWVLVMLLKKEIKYFRKINLKL